MDGMVVLRNRDWVGAAGGGSHRLARQTMVNRRAADYRGWIWIPELDGVSCREPEIVTTSR